MLQNFFLNNFDQQINIFFLAHRNNFGINIFQFITLFGNWQILVPLILLLVLFLYKKNKQKFIIPLLITVGGGELITFLGKLFFQRPRPNLAIFSETDFSFPSGHATIAVAFYGYLAYMLIKELAGGYKWLIIILTIILIALIGFSRIYLGVHYFTDVLAGYLVGSLALLVGISLTEHLSPNKK